MTNSKTVLESVIPAVSKSNGDYYGKDACFIAENVIRQKKRSLQITLS